MRTLISALSLAILTISTAAGVSVSSAAEPTPSKTIRVLGSDSGSRFVSLGIGKSIVIELPRPIKDVLVADPRIANAVVPSSRRAYIIGSAVGQTNVYFFDAAGKQIAGFDLAVSRDLNGIRAVLQKMFPDANIRVDGIGTGSVILSGTVQTPAEAQTAYDVAARLLNVGTAEAAPRGSQIVNAITVRDRDQVMLKVTVAEVQRDVLKQLGVTIDGSLGSGATVVNFNSTPSFGVTGVPPESSITGIFKNRVNATLKAMENAGVIRTLAEPNLSAISGESATFLAGGEFPILAGYSCSLNNGSNDCNPSIQFKKFGVSLNFTPVVLSEGRISLKVMTEVSDLSSENAISFRVNINSPLVTVPSIRVRRAETTLEIPSGGSMAMAGMIQEQTKQQISGIPALQQLPVLGSLFRSRDYLNKQSELMVIVTPYVVHAVARKDLSRPDDGYADASDPSSVLLGRLNRVYGVARRPEKPAQYHGRYGFILD
jgi:pilus assembly protein CpaC